MIEVEMKVVLSAGDSVEEKLLTLGFTKQKAVLEKDAYYDNAKQEIRGNDKAIRIRKATDAETGVCKSEINFKGPKYDCISATRPEFETQVGDAEAMHRILNALGYEVVEPQVIKERQLFRKEEMTACLDRVDGLGVFLELEILVDHESQREKAFAKIRQMIELLGYRMEDTTAQSYLSMLQEPKGQSAWQKDHPRGKRTVLVAKGPSPLKRPL